jgi:hypothetical protein
LIDRKGVVDKMEVAGKSHRFIYNNSEEVFGNPLTKSDFVKKTQEEVDLKKMKTNSEFVHLDTIE